MLLLPVTSLLAQACRAGLLGVPVDRANRLSDALNALRSVSGYHHGRHPALISADHVMRFISDAIESSYLAINCPSTPNTFRPRRDFLIERGWLIAAWDGTIRHEVIGAHLAALPIPTLLPPIVPSTPGQAPSQSHLLPQGDRHLSGHQLSIQYSERPL